MRIKSFALAGAVGLSALVLTTQYSLAAPHFGGGGMRMGGMHMGGMRPMMGAGPRFAAPRIVGPRVAAPRFAGPRFAGSRFHHRRFVGVLPFIAGAAASSYYYDDCWQSVWTPYGWRRQYVCVYDDNGY